MLYSGLIVPVEKSSVEDAGGSWQTVYSLSSLAVAPSVTSMFLFLYTLPQVFLASSVTVYEPFSLNVI